MVQRSVAAPHTERAARRPPFLKRAAQKPPSGFKNSNGLQVGCRRFATALVALELVAELLALIQAAEARALDRGDVDEDILIAILRLNEAIALLNVEPLDGADGHRFSKNMEPPPGIGRRI